MSDPARERIFSRLRAAADRAPGGIPQSACLPIETFSTREKVDRLKNLMEVVRSEVHVVATKNWTAKLKEILTLRNVKRLLYAPETAIGTSLQKAWQDAAGGLPELIAYDENIERFKEKLFTVDAGITSTVGGIAETGALILWPSEKEPRLMSLVPPIHIAILEAGKIHNTFCEVIQKEHWPDKMPTNVVLISGPSKTADIELTLAFGVHGPKELIVLIVEE